MEIVNPHGDYHMHSIAYSDGFNTVDEMVVRAGDIGLVEIAFTDHSLSHLDYHRIGKKTSSSNTRRWQNVHNDVKVLFGVEADLLNEEGDVNFEGYTRRQDFVVLSTHGRIFEGDHSKITQGYLKALERHHDKIGCLGHLCTKKILDRGHLDVGTVVEAANHFGVVPELNCANLHYGVTDMDALELMLSMVDRIYVNSDAHTLWDLMNLRRIGFEFLREKGHMLSIDFPDEERNFS